MIKPANYRRGYIPHTSGYQFTSQQNRHRSIYSFAPPSTLHHHTPPPPESLPSNSHVRFDPLQQFGRRSQRRRVQITLYTNQPISLHPSLQTTRPAHPQTYLLQPSNTLLMRPRLGIYTPLSAHVHSFRYISTPLPSSPPHRHTWPTPSPSQPS